MTYDKCEIDQKVFRLIEILASDDTAVLCMSQEEIALWDFMDTLLDSRRIKMKIFLTAYHRKKDRLESRA